MSKVFKVWESRGCGIGYVEFEGTLNECEDFLERNTFENHNGFRVWPDGNGDCYRNGNGYPWTYSIKEAL